MKVKIVNNIPLPQDWNVSGVRGNTGFSHLLREMKEGESFEFTVSDKKTENEFNSLRNRIYMLQKARFNRRNFVIRLIDKDAETSIKVYRVWAAPLGLVKE